MSDTIQERLSWAAAEAVAEIDRLRAELDEEREAYKTALSNRNYWRRAQRKELLLKEHAERELAEKDKRIAELERISLSNEGIVINRSDVHIITTDQINAVWEYVRNQDPYDPPNGCQDCQLMWRMGGLMALQKLGIKACRKCGGTKWIYVAAKRKIPCDCPNNGWVMEMEER